MLAGLGVMWSLTDFIHAGEDEREVLRAPAALRKIDISGVLFFVGNVPFSLFFYDCYSVLLM
jgi:hypothetical protein